MAQVDFSNAVLDVNGNFRPMGVGDYLGLATLNGFYDENGNMITTGFYFSVLLNTVSKISLLFSGTFTASGTEFLMKYTDYYWKVSNISFANGDAYSFVIDIEINGNT